MQGRLVRSSTNDRNKRVESKQRAECDNGELQTM